MRKITTQEFIQKAKLIHGENKYDYTSVNYINNATNITLICKKHGIFLQSPSVHIKGSGCPKCAAIKMSGIDNFKEKANLIHNGKYDYSKANYVNNSTKIDIICIEHGVFTTTPNSHLSKKIGCHKCSNTEKYTRESYIEKSNKVHNNYYKYDNMVFRSMKHKIVITCPIHGDFSQDPHNHMRGQTCAKCAGKFMNTDMFIEKANKIHNNKYSYEYVIYLNQNTNVDITCAKHGIFRQAPDCHINGGNGCPKCKKSKGENKIESVLIEKEINYKPQFTFKDLRDINLLKFDFGILDKNGNLLYLLEYNGEQHYKFVPHIHKYESKYEDSKIKDKMKIDYCKNNNIPLHIIRYDENIMEKINGIL
jgi:hypothetical protein